MPAITETRPTLTRGDEGWFVNNAQNVLKILGYYKEEVTSTFDIITEHAVKSFQADWKLRIDGVVGPETWAALDKALIGEPPPNGPGGFVGWIQEHKLLSVAIVGGIIGGLYLVFRKK